MMWKKIESVQHIVNGCEKLAQKDCKRRHDNVTIIIIIIIKINNKNS